MSQKQSAEGVAEIGVENIGGIDDARLELPAGVTVLTGRNATNRTSFLQALMAALGSERVSLKGNAEEGRVELAFDGETYTRTLTRRNGTVSTDGDPYLDDPEGADLFAFLLETNEARQAVARGDDLREVIMRPVDTDAIRTDIDRLEAEKRDLDDELDRLESLDTRLPGLEEQRDRLQRDIEEKREELAAKEAEIEDADTSVDDSREREAAFEDALDDLQETRSDLETVRYRLDTERESLAALEDERDDLRADLDDAPETPAGDLDEVEAEIDRLRSHKQSLESTISQLQRILQFNEELLDGSNPEFQRALRHEGDDGDGALTEQLVEDTTVCWTCGSEVERGAIDDTLDSLRDLRREKSDERNRIDAELDELKTERSELRTAQDHRDRLERNLREVEREIEERETAIEEYTDDRDRLEGEVETLEADVQSLEEDEQSDLLDRHKQANQLEFELGRLEDDREDTAADIADLEAQLDERTELRERRDAVDEELADLRTRIEQLEVQAIEEFNDHMATILGVLEYENIERIWIERTEREVREGRRKVKKSVFDLHVVRSDDGTTYEDTIEHLSESEREVTGLVFALAGYLVHDLHETLPFVVLDSLEALDSDRVATLVEYFGEYSEFLVVALLPEDAAALDDHHPRITEI